MRCTAAIIQEEPDVVAMEHIRPNGGGVRGIMEVVILDNLMRRIQKLRKLDSLPRPCDYFHLIGGTSTGGLVTIMLGRMKMTTEQAIKGYHDFAKKIFGRKKSKVRFWEYNEETLAQAVRDMVEYEGNGETMLEECRDIKTETGHTFVCTIEKNNWQDAVLFRSYVNKEREDLVPGIAIWEAARATTAAPPYFKPMEIGSRVFMDGALRRNNPCPAVVEEATDLFGVKRKVGLVLSVGTGRAEEPFGMEIKVGKWKQLLSFLGAVKGNLTDSERDHGELEKRLEHYPHTYYRFNPGDGAKDVKLTDWRGIPKLERITRAYIATPEISEKLDEVANTIVQGVYEGLALGNIVNAERLSLEMQAKVEERATDNFVGREDVIGKMKQFFSPEKSTGRREFFLSGQSGVGKTELALQFAKDFESHTTIRQSYRRYISVFFPGSRDKSDEDVRNWLDDTDDDWILIFDNCSKEVRNDYFLPKKDKGNIIFTAIDKEVRFEYKIRNDGWASLEDLNEADALELLRVLTGIGEDEWEESRTAALEIVNCCARRPKCIEMAGKKILNTEESLEAYLEKYKKTAKFQYEKSFFRDASDDATRSAYTTFEVTHEWLQDIRERGKDLERSRIAGHALDLLSSICFFHNSGLGKDLFETVADRRVVYIKGGKELVPLKKLSPLIDVRNEDYVWNPGPVNDALDILARFSLIKTDQADGRGWIMHDLVHQWARGRLGEADQKENLVEARCLITYALPIKRSDFRDPRIVGPLLRHIITCRVHHMDIDSDDPEQQAFQDMQMGKSLAAQNLDLEAAELLELACRAENHPNKMMNMVIKDLIPSYKATKKYDAAYDRLWDLVGRVPLLFPGDPDEQNKWEFILLVELGDLCLRKKDLQTALCAYDEALKLGHPGDNGIPALNYYEIFFQVARVGNLQGGKKEREAGWNHLTRDALPALIAQSLNKPSWSQKALKGMCICADSLVSGGHPISAILLREQILESENQRQYMVFGGQKAREGCLKNRKFFADWLLLGGFLGLSEKVFREILEPVMETFGPLHNFTALTTRSLLHVMVQLGKGDEGEIMIDESLAQCRRLYGPLDLPAVQALMEVLDIFKQCRLESDNLWLTPRRFQERGKQLAGINGPFINEEKEKEHLVGRYTCEIEGLELFSPNNPIVTILIYPKNEESLRRYEELCPKEAEDYKQRVAPYENALGHKESLSEETSREWLDQAFHHLETFCKIASLEPPKRPSPTDFERVRDSIGDCGFSWI
ncbi:Patatin-like protein 2 [Zalerion maritima]|uniref:Patatin-like protein 2 n=1 Tax=Zalerion maritima TaxID=339359 RepID=A0AAD5RQE6_9PEZI|nr:Patatin-like protein 2 [Zalerion maritima]